MDTCVFDVFSNGIGRSEGKELRHLVGGYDDLEMLRTYVRACGVDQPEMLIMMVVATVRNVLDDELMDRKKEELGELLKEDNEEFFIAQIDEHLKKEELEP